MGIALLTSKRSEDPNIKAGACIAKIDHTWHWIQLHAKRCTRIQLPWNRDENNELDKQYPYVCHAAMNAIMNCRKRDLKGSRMYMSLLPCNECAKLKLELKKCFIFKIHLLEGIESRLQKNCSRLLELIATNILPNVNSYANWE